MDQQQKSASWSSALLGRALIVVGRGLMSLVEGETRSSQMWSELIGCLFCCIVGAVIWTIMRLVGQDYPLLLFMAQTVAGFLVLGWLLRWVKKTRGPMAVGACGRDTTTAICQEGFAHLFSKLASALRSAAEM